jgi:hypothetical protein
MSSTAYAALFPIADADKDGVCGHDEGLKFFQRFAVPPDALEKIWAQASGGDPDAGLNCSQFCEAMRLISLVSVV